MRKLSEKVTRTEQKGLSSQIFTSLSKNTKVKFRYTFDRRWAVKKK